VLQLPAVFEAPRVDLALLVVEAGARARLCAGPQSQLMGCYAGAVYLQQYVDGIAGQLARSHKIGHI
jgi:hypothetical protein